ncbi:MAG: DNA ligase [Caldimonas sp.]
MSEPTIPALRRRPLLLAAFAAGLPGLAPAGVAAAGPGPAAEPMLAAVYKRQVDPVPYLVSEKYDGVRAIWDGGVLRHRSGREVPAPREFLAALPAEPLDGELWLGRGRFEALSSIVRTQSARPSAWAAIRYMVFELPGGAGTFAERAGRLGELVARAGARQLVAAPQGRVGGRAELQGRLESVVSAGGEGLMLHLATAPVVSGRSDVLLKLKPHLDAEAVVVAQRAGVGKYRGQVGALEVEAVDGRRFLIGSGLSDAERRVPPRPGTVITYRYRDLTANGLPRFATYVRRYDAP